MGSASRIALETAITALASAKGVTRASGEQLLSADRDIAGSPQLRAVLADPSIDGPAKTKLIGSIFGGWMPVAKELLGTLVGARWSDSDQLVDGIEEVGIRAIAARPTRCRRIAAGSRGSCSSSPAPSHPMPNSSSRSAAT